MIGFIERHRGSCRKKQCVVYKLNTAHIKEISKINIEILAILS